MRTTKRLAGGLAVAVAVLLVTVLQPQTAAVGGNASGPKLGEQGSRWGQTRAGTHTTDSTCCYAYWDTVYKCDFENMCPGGGWESTSDGHLHIAKPTRSPFAHSGDNCALIDTAGNYPPNVDSRLISGWRGATIALPTLAPGEELELSFWHWYSMSCNGGYPCYGCDYGYVEISTNGGSTFVQLPGYTAFTGYSHGWFSPPPIDLSAYAGLQVRIAFHFTSNGGCESRGWFVDDVVIRKGWDPRWTSVGFPNCERWNAGLGGWIVDDPLWQVGVPVDPPGPGPSSGTWVQRPSGWFGPSGGPCAATQLAAGYWPSADARLISPPIHLGPDPWLDFIHWYSMSCNGGYPCYGCDYGYVEVAMVRGHRWGPWQSQASFTGSSGGWTPVQSIHLSAYADSTVRIAFHFTSNGGCESRGWLIDDIQISSVVSDVGDGRLPEAPMLRQNVPNPFNPTTTIRFSTAKEARASLIIIDVAGHRVRTLFDEALPAGEHQRVWDGRNERGDNMPSGVYLYQLWTPEGTSTRRMVLVR